MPFSGFALLGSDIITGGGGNSMSLSSSDLPFFFPFLPFFLFFLSFLYQKGKKMHKDIIKFEWIIIKTSLNRLYNLVYNLQCMSYSFNPFPDNDTF